MSNSNMSNQYKIEDLPLNMLEFVKAPKNNTASKGSTVIYVNKHGARQQQLFIQFPMMFSWGAAQVILQNDKSNESTQDKYALSIQFPPFDAFTETDRSFFNKIEELEELILKKAVENSLGWYGKNRMRESIEDTFGRILKYPKHKETKAIDKSRPPSIKIKLSKYNDKFQFNVYDTKKNLLYSPTSPNTSHIDVIENQLIPSKSDVMCIVTLSLWVVGTNLYPVFTLKQVICKKPDLTSFNFNECMLSYEDEENNVNNNHIEYTENKNTKSSYNTNNNNTNNNNTNNTTNNDVNDSDDEFNIPQPSSVKPVVHLPEPVPSIVQQSNENYNKQDDIEEEEIVITTKKPKKTKGVRQQ